MSVVIGSQAGGVLGMILSVPVAAFIKLLLNEIYKELYQ
jgi:predicted PurR-regulated permease PerM